MSLPPLEEVYVGDPPPETPLISSTPPAKPSKAVAATPDPNEVALVVGTVRKTGWLKITVVRGIEIMPSQFMLTLTDRYAGDSAQVDINAGDACQVMIGRDLVLTGNVDRVRRRLKGAVIEIRGRSLCRNLVDCVADPTKLPTLQVSQSSASDVITKLAGMYSIPVRVLGGVATAIIPQFNINIGELLYPIIDRVARYGQFLAYDDTDGSLVLAPVGIGSAASGFAEGVNMEDADYEVSVDQRYTEYDVYLSSSYTLFDISPLPPPLQTVVDTTMPPGRKMIVLSEQNQIDPSLAQKRGLWELVRRYGRSNVLTVATDNWRDSAGTLWAINNLVTVTSVHLKITGQQFLIAQVAFRRDATGTRADLVLMPPAAFTPEPLVLTPQDPEIANARAKAGS